MNKWKWCFVTIGVIAACIAAVVIVRSVQRNRDLAETLLWMDQTYNPHDGGDNLGQGHGWEIHYLRKGQTEQITEKFQMNFTRLGGCSIVIHSETFPEGVYNDLPSTHEYTMNLCDIDPESIKIKTYDLHKDVFDCADPEQVKGYELDCQNAEIEFRTRDGVTQISEKRVETFMKLTKIDHKTTTDSKTNKCWLIVDDVAYAQRLAKALKHAIELCGGKASKF
jgi:hypothetical protein